jgi:hypothetical protein
MLLNSDIQAIGCCVCLHARSHSVHKSTRHHRCQAVVKKSLIYGYFIKLFVTHFARLGMNNVFLNGFGINLLIFKTN